MGLRKIITVIRPVSYFENFENKITGNTISKEIFPGIIYRYIKWQTIAVEDIGKGVRGILSKPDQYKDRAINIASEELTVNEMTAIMQKLVSTEGIKTNYVMIPRIALKLIEYDIGVMADWIERSGYGAGMNN